MTLEEAKARLREIRKEQGERIEEIREIKLTKECAELTDAPVCWRVQTEWYERLAVLKKLEKESEEEKSQIIASQKGALTWAEELGLP